MSKLSFVKYQGAGNDFILIDDRALFFDPSCVSSLCRRKFGIGADGLILLQNGSDADFRMRIFNSDGSEAESCGNGLRCLMQFLLHLGLPKKPYRIATADRIVEADYLGEKVSVQMGEARNVKQLYIWGREVHFLDTGVPHAILFVPDAARIDVMKEGAALRHHAAFQPRGANVNFASLQNGAIRLRTFERGLEGESLACGTGAAAVGFLAAQQYHLPNPIQIQCLGGGLEIEVVGQNIRMIGPAEKVFAGRVSVDLPLYTNAFKSWEYDKEAAQIFVPGASDHCLWQGASEGQKFAAKPTQSPGAPEGRLVLWGKA